LRIYLSVPMIANRNTAIASMMAKAISDSGNEVSSPWVLGPIEAHNPVSLNIFARDMRGAENSDAILADVSNPSIGVGMELMAAYKAGRRVIVVAKEGSKVSRMLLHMDRKESIEFKDEEDLYGKLVRLLSPLASRRDHVNQK
jgi:2'-deoxynucleoside 5'-phosphate N-hydrolase